MKLEGLIKGVLIKKKKSVEFINLSIKSNKPKKIIRKVLSKLSIANVW